MCGIFGVAGWMEHKIVFMSVAALRNESRGYDSTGVGRVGIDGRHAVYKSTACASEFIQYKKYKEFLADPSNVLIGHCRWATMGDVNRNNSHPFKMGKTIGTHNGTVRNVRRLRKLTGKKYPVDSQYLIHLLETKGNIDDAAGSTNVAYCQKGDSADLRLIRNGKPLSVAWDRWNRWFAYSSTEEDLRIALSVANESDFDVWPLDDQATCAIFLDENGMICDVVDDELTRPADVWDYALSPSTKSADKEYQDHVRWWEERQSDGVSTQYKHRSMNGYQCLNCNSDGCLDIEHDDFVRCEFCQKEFHIDQYLSKYGEIDE